MVNNLTLDPARQRLIDLAERRGTSLSALSKLIGRNASYLQQFIRKGSPRKLCLLYTSPSPRDATLSRMPSSA